MHIKGDRRRILAWHGGVLLPAAFFVLFGYASADTIVVDGERFDDVYIRSTESLYIVLKPNEGTSVVFRHSEVGENGIDLTANPEERAKLFEAWVATRLKARKAKEAAASIPRPEASRSAPVLTNHRKRSRRTRKSPTMFVNSKGNTLLTDRPEMYEGRPDYIEVDLDFVLIQVPSKFRGLGGTNLDGTTRIDRMIRYYANIYGVDPFLVYAVIKVESDGYPLARSSKGARGLMQLMPGTAADMGVTNAFDSAQNIAGGTQYLAKLLALFDNDLPMALAGYNAGPGNVQKYKGIPPFRETRDYVKNVQEYYRDYSRQGAPYFGRSGMSLH